MYIDGSMIGTLPWYKIRIYHGINFTMIASGAESRRALGAFLRAHRERLPVPPSLSGRRRRTPGLRREEVADACGVSSTWYTWLEQGRDISASATALSRLAEVLLLSSAERAYLFELAGRRDPAGSIEAEHGLSPYVLALPQRIISPAYLLDITWTAQAWNAAATRLFTGWLDGAADRNLLRFIFLSPAARRLISDWEERGRRVVAEFRADYSRQLRNPAMRSLINELSECSPDFARHWEEQAVLHREGGERCFNLPGGLRRYHQASFILASHPDIKLVTLTMIES
jgi:transcriptional regulator with XRE-family HTH domain